jgi:hypothetical protein
MSVTDVETSRKHFSDILKKNDDASHTPQIFHPEIDSGVVTVSRNTTSECFGYVVSDFSHMYSIRLNELKIFALPI